MRNTKKEGHITLFVYKEKPSHYVGVCLEFDIIQEGKNPIETMERIKQSAFNYLNTVRKKDLSEDLLNQRAPKEYWKKYQNLLKAKVTAIQQEIQRRYWQSQIQEMIYNINFNHDGLINAK